mmetsp:Transcript_70743/g.166834  ORF Transcript_70743/g.166834 Transcript_70743/m.166834 type:complete len:83 (+) Transcript_70743:828-1076(+)
MVGQHFSIQSRLCCRARWGFGEWVLCRCMRRRQVVTVTLGIVSALSMLTRYAKRPATPPTPPPTRDTGEVCIQSEPVDDDLD